MRFNTILTFLALLALNALVQAYPTNLTSYVSANIPTDLNGSRPFDQSTEDLGSGIQRRNPPGWDQIPVADYALLNHYETLGRTWFSPMIYLRINPLPPVAFTGAPNPADMRPFNDHMEDRLGHNVDGWQRTIHLQELEDEWTENDATAAYTAEFTPIQSIIENLPVGHVPAQAAWDSPRMARSDIAPRGANTCILWEQDQNFKSFGPSGRRNGPGVAQTDAFYRNWYNVVDGVITMSEQLSPRDAAPDRPQRELPRNTAWSDLTWKTWWRLHATQPARRPLGIPRHGWGRVELFATPRNIRDMVPFLNWIVVDSIDDRHTLSIMKKCLQVRNRHTHLPPFNAQQMQADFVVGHWCFNALLATKASQNIASLLGMHKAPDALGHKLLAGVFITSGQPSGAGASAQAGGPVLVWRVERFIDGIPAMMSRQQAHYQNRKDQQGHLKYDDVPLNAP